MTCNTFLNTYCHFHPVAFFNRYNIFYNDSCCSLVENAVYTFSEYELVLFIDIKAHKTCNIDKLQTAFYIYFNV